MRPFPVALLVAAALALGLAARDASQDGLYAVPGRLDLGASEAGYAEEVYPVGWSADGRRLAFVYRRSGMSATVSSLALVVQDLATDAVLARTPLSDDEEEEEPDLAASWAAHRAEIERVLRAHGIVEAAFRLETLPILDGVAVDTAVAYDVWEEQEPGEDPSSAREGVRRSRLLLRATPAGRSKEVEDRTYGGTEYEPLPLAVGVVGVLRSPTGDRLAVVVKEVEWGFEGDRVQAYRFVGAGIRGAW